VAGLRGGLADPRGNLMLTFLSLADAKKPRWIVWENVPGVLSSNGGRDFGTFLQGLAECGYGFAYRVLDAQFFGVAQRRRRVFVVGHFGDWRPAAAVLFESSSLSGNPKPSREKGERVAPTVVQGPPFSRTGNQRVECEAIVPTLANCLQTTCNDYSRADGFNMIAQPIPYDLHQITAPVNRQARSPGDPCHTLAKQNAHNAGIVSIQGNLIGREAGGPQGVGASDEGVMYTLTKADVHGVAQPIAIQDCRAVEKAQNGKGWNDEGTAYTVDTHATQGVAQPVAHGIFNEVADTVTCKFSKGAELLQQGAQNGGNCVYHSMAVRRLTPRECERLQGFRDDYTLIPWRGKEAPDGPRYKALGNSMAVPVMRWIGERINALGGAK